MTIRWFIDSHAAMSDDWAYDNKIILMPTYHNPILLTVHDYLSPVILFVPCPYASSE